eukprot:tig00020902_g15007.t1
MCGPEELMVITRVEFVQTAAQLAGLLRSERVRAAASKDPEKEVPPMLPAVDDLARRGNAEQALRELCHEVLRAFTDDGSLAFSADVAALVHSGDPDLCRALVDALLRKASKAMLADHAVLSALAYVAGHLPPDTLTASDWAAVLKFASEQVELLSVEGLELGPSDAEAQVALELTAAVLAAYEAASSAASSAPAPAAPARPPLPPPPPPPPPTPPLRWRRSATAPLPPRRPPPTPPPPHRPPRSDITPSPPPPPPPPPAPAPPRLVPPFPPPLHPPPPNHRSPFLSYSCLLRTSPPPPFNDSLGPTPPPPPHPPSPPDLPNPPPPPFYPWSPSPRKRLDVDERRIAALSEKLKRLEGRARAKGWWRAEAAAVVAGQALASVRSGGERFGDVVRRCKAAGRILKKLYAASKVIMEGVSSMGATTVIDLVFWAKDIMSDEKGGILEAAREMWNDARIVVGKGAHLQGQNVDPWYARARLLGSLAAGGQLEELEALLRDGGGEGLADCASSRQLALVLASALVRVRALHPAPADPAPVAASVTELCRGPGQVAEGPSPTQAAAAAGLLERLARKAGELGGADAAEIAAGALAHVARLDDGGGGGGGGGGGAARTALQRLADVAVGCLAGFRHGAARVMENGVGLVEDVAELVADVPGLEGAAGVAGDLAAAARRAKDGRFVQRALSALAAPERLLQLASAPSPAAPSGPARTARSAPPGKLKKAPPLRPTPMRARVRNGYLGRVLQKYKEAVEAAGQVVKRAHVHGREQDLADPGVRLLLSDLAVDLCGSAPFRRCPELVCASRAFVFVASPVTAREVTCLKALDEAIETGQEVFQFYLNGAESVLQAMPVGVDMRLSRFDRWQLDVEALRKADVYAAARSNKKDPLDVLASGVQKTCRFPREYGKPAAGQKQLTTRWFGGAGGSSSGQQPWPSAPKWVVEESLTAEEIVQTFSTSLQSIASCWSEAEHWEKGERWVDLVARAIRNCTHFVFIVSPAIDGSQHIQEEVAYACSQDCALVALYLKQQGKAVRSSWVEERLERAAPGRVHKIDAAIDVDPIDAALKLANAVKIRTQAIAARSTAATATYAGATAAGQRARAQAGQIQPATALGWTEADVEYWIRSHEPLAQFAKRFSVLKGRGLLSLTDSALKQLGINHVATRKRFLLEIAALSKAALEKCDRKLEPLCWTEEDVVAWVRLQGPLAKFAELFTFTGGPGLLSLSDVDLERMGVDNFPARQRLLEKIAELEANAIAQSLHKNAKPETDTAAESRVVELAPAPSPAEVDGIRASIKKFAAEVADELRQDQDLALYVPPRATPDPKLPFKHHVDLHEKAVTFLKALRPGANVGEDAAAKPKSKRVLLLLGGAGTSKSTFLAGMAGGVPKGSGLRQHVAAKLGVAEKALPALRDSIGLVLLLDGYDEMGVTDGMNLWQENGVSDWASGALLTCRTEFLASLPVDKPHEASFAPAEKDGEADRDDSALVQLHTVPFTNDQRDKYLQHYVERHENDEAAWTFEQYQVAFAKTPGLAAFAENPFSLSMAARVLPTKTATGGRLGMRGLYRLFLRDWLRRELYRGGTEIPRDATVQERVEDDFVKEGTGLCTRLACLLFRMSASQAMIPDPRVQRQQKTGAEVNSKPVAAPPPSPEQGALCALLGDRALLLVRNSCPLRQWRQGGSLGFAFVHKTLQEFLSAEALLDSLSSKATPSNYNGIDITLHTRSIVGDTTLVRFLAEAVQHEPQAIVADALVRIIELSRPRDSSGKAIENEAPEVAPEVVAAANAATILVAGHYSLAGRNLRGHPALLHKSAVRAVAWTPDRKWIVSGSDDNLVRVWDAETGTELRKLEGHKDNIISVAVHVSTDGKWIVSGSNDKSLQVWDAETGAGLRKLQGHTGWVTSVVVSADGKRIISGSSDKSVRVWEMETGAEMRKLEGHTRNVNSVAVSKDGKRIVSGSDDKSVRVWDMETGAELRKLEGHTGCVHSVTVSEVRKGKLGAGRLGRRAPGLVNRWERCGF